MWEWVSERDSKKVCVQHLCARTHPCMRVSLSNSSMELTSWQGKPIPPTFPMYTPAVNQPSDRGKTGEDWLPISLHVQSQMLHGTCNIWGTCDIWDTCNPFTGQTRDTSQGREQNSLRSGSRTEPPQGGMQPVDGLSHLHTILSTGWIRPIGEAIWTAGVHQMPTLKCNQSLYLTLRKAAVRSRFPTSETS